MNLPRPSSERSVNGSTRPPEDEVPVRLRSLAYLPYTGAIRTRNLPPTTSIEATRTPIALIERARGADLLDIPGVIRLWIRKEILILSVVRSSIEWRWYTYAIKRNRPREVLPERANADPANEHAPIRGCGGAVVHQRSMAGWDQMPALRIGQRPGEVSPS